MFNISDFADVTKAKLVQWRDVVVPSAFVALAINVITQGMCIRGVNRLTSVSRLCPHGSHAAIKINPLTDLQRVNSTTVHLVLTLRKAVSLAVSVWYYGSGFSLGLGIGGGMVLRKPDHYFAASY